MKPIVTRCGPYGYEVMNSSGNFFSLQRLGNRFNCLPLKIKSKDQMTGVKLKNVPNEIKNIFYEIQSK